MSFLRHTLDALVRLKPLEITLFVMNLALVAEVWHEFDAAARMRSENIARYVLADIATDTVLAGCVVVPQ